MLRLRLPIDPNGCTTYGGTINIKTLLNIDNENDNLTFKSFTEFVNASRDVFAVKLNEPNLNTSAFQFAIQDINAMEKKVKNCVQFVVVFIAFKFPCILYST